ncbi:MAG: DUF4199 domain-containing protein [Ferruginibacter sp.]
MKNLTATIKGVITGLLMIIMSVVFFYSLKLPVNGMNQFLIIAIFVIGIFWSLVSFKERAPETAGFKDYFSEGFKTFIVVTFFMAVFTFVFYKLNPQILENGIKENNILVMKEGNHTEAEIDENAQKMRDIFMPMMLTINTVKYLLIGSLVSLITAGFFIKKKV